ncbi:hypothetical protein KY363_01300 [Candidatus Woesearchaeota archaeon]|nr:hypothetical protein [Candidatus Woesearchaeota archaeon]
MDNEYTSMWQILTRNPAGKLFIATVAAVGIAAAYTLARGQTQTYEPDRTHYSQSYAQFAQARSPDAGVPKTYAELSDIVNKR